MVTIRVTHVVLHMADDRIAPVGHVHRAVATHLDIRWAEVWIARYQNGLDLLGCNLRTVVFDFMLQYAKETDAIADKEIALVLVWKLTAGKNAGGGHGPHSHLEPWFVANAFANIHIGA